MPYIALQAQTDHTAHSFMYVSRDGAPPVDGRKEHDQEPPSAARNSGWSTQAAPPSDMVQLPTANKMANLPMGHP